MTRKLIVHPRIAKRHPEIKTDDVVTAWNNCTRFIPRLSNSKDDYIAIGADSKGRMIEMVATIDDSGSFVVYHAKTPPSSEILKELGFPE